ncbi:hypothetical protein [Rhodoferax sp.]|nr:hypothetical protein [Rhodoferax sp.]
MTQTLIALLIGIAFVAFAASVVYSAYRLKLKFLPKKCEFSL